MSNILATKFIFNGTSSDQFNLTICDFNSASGAISHIAGGEITLNTANHNNKWNMISNEYKEPLSFSFSVCKQDGSFFEDVEMSEIIRSIQRNDGYKKLYFDTMPGYYYLCTCTNIEALTVGANIVGFTFNFTCDSIYKYEDCYPIKINMTTSSTTKTITDYSDIGEVIPSLKIELLESCNFSIHNSYNNQTFKINNCASGEIITFDGKSMYFTSSVSGRNVLEDFNYKYLKIGNTYDTRKNVFTISGKAKITINYIPRKIGVIV